MLLPGKFRGNKPDKIGNKLRLELCMWDVLALQAKIFEEEIDKRTLTQHRLLLSRLC